MNHSELFYFVARCLAMDEHPEFRETIISGFSDGKVHPDDFIVLCDRHLILPAIYLNFKKYNLTDLFPVDYTGSIAAIWEGNRNRNLGIVSQVEEINHALAAGNIMPVYLKGTANLLDNVYSDAGERMIGDIDLLVQDKDYLKAADLIMNLGYYYEGKIYGDVTTSKHFPRLFRPGGPADIEIHRIPVDMEFSKQYNAEIIFRHKKSIPGKINCYVPSDEHKVIHNFIHAQLSNLGHGFRQIALRDLYDLYQLAKRTDRSSVISQVEEKEKAVSWLGYADRVFHTPDGYFANANKRATRFYKQVEWFLDHPRIHGWHKLSVKVFELIFHRFIPGISKVFKEPATAGSYLKFLADPGWYRMVGYRIKNFYRNYVSRW